MQYDSNNGIADQTENEYLLVALTCLWICLHTLHRYMQEFCLQSP